MKIRLLFIFVCTALSGSISYNDIINQAQFQDQPYVNGSDLARVFDSLPDRQERIDRLWGCGQLQPNGATVISISNVPATDQARVTLSLRMEPAKDDNHEFPDEAPGTHDGYLITLFTPGYPRNILFKGFWYKNHHEGSIDEVKPGYAIDTKAFNHDISGTTTFRIWDGLCWLCTVGTIEVIDKSVLPEDLDISIRSLYTYMWSDTFYERFGYKRARGSMDELAEYQRAKNFLINRPAREILDDFKDNPLVFNALIAGYNELKLFPAVDKPLEQAILGDFIRVPYVRIKALQNNGVHPSTGRDQNYYLTILRTIYFNCIADYRSSNSKKNQAITRMQELLMLEDVFEKEYR